MLFLASLRSLCRLEPNKIQTFGEIPAGRGCDFCASLPREVRS